MGSAIPRCGHRTCHGTEEGAVLASVSTIVVVAGQTQVHVVTLATVRPAIVPPIVPEPPQSGPFDDLGAFDALLVLTRSTASAIL